MGDSAIDRFQNDWLKTLIADSPLLATSLGVDQHQDVLGDFSPEQVESKLEKLKIARLKLQKLSEQDRTDLIGKHAIKPRQPLALWPSRMPQQKVFWWR